MRISIIVSMVSLVALALGYVASVFPSPISTAYPELSSTNVFRPYLSLAVTGSGPSTLLPRWRGTPPKATEEEWTQAACNGARLNGMMYYSDGDAAKLLVPAKDTMATVHTYESLEDWGYSEAVGEQGPWDDTVFYGGGRVLNALRLSNKGTQSGGTWDSFEIRHGDMEEIGTETYRFMEEKMDRRYTGAEFDFAIDISNGAILGLRFKSVKYSIQEHNLNIPNNELPDLRQASDIMWCAWQGLENEDGDVSNFIRHFIILSIVNVPTVGILKATLDRANKQLSPFPGTVYTEADGWSFYAILGTPIAGMVVHFLLRAKEDIGIQAVQSINVFQCDNRSKDACLLFNIGPVTQRSPDDDGEHDSLTDDEPDIDHPSANASANASAVLLDRREEGNQVIRIWRVDD